MLVGPVWEALPAADQQFLASVTVLDVLSVDGCAALTQEDTHETADRLRRLHAWGLLRRLGNAPSQFAQRRLVAEYARRMLADKGRAEGARLHRLASEYLAQSGDVESAIAHALDAGDMPRVLVLLEGTVGEFLETGRASAVRALYSRSTEPLVETDHLHLLAAAWSELLAGNLSGAQRWLPRLVAAVAELPAPTTDPAAETVGEFTQDVESGSTWLRAETLFLQSRVAEWQGRPALAREFADRAVRSFGDRWTRMVHQGAVMQAARMRLWSDEPDTARSMLVRASARPGTREYFRRVALPSLRACLAAEEGRAYRARHLAEQALHATAVLGPLGQFDDADALIARSTAHLDLDEPAQAAGDAELLAARAEAMGHVTYRVLAMLALARAHSGQGGVAQAAVACEQARAILRAEAPGSELLTMVDRTELSIRMDAGDRPGALTVLRRSPPGAARDRATARLALRPLTEPSRRPSIRPPADPRQEVESRLLSAMASVSSRPAEAERQLRAAAEIAVGAGILTALRGYPEPLTVLADLVSTRPDGGAVAVLAAHARPASPTTLVPRPEAVRLSDGERHLLSVMTAHRGQAELARALGVSVNTVKTRLRRLYRKLGVSDHASALREAQSRGLLTDTQ
jgi:LuxR family maltose regulon positive regulatory protein